MLAVWRLPVFLLSVLLPPVSDPMRALCRVVAA